MTGTFTWQTGDGSISLTLSPGQFMTAVAIPSTVLDLAKQADIAKQLDAADRAAIKTALKHVGYKDDGDDQHDNARILHLACTELASICGAANEKLLTTD